MVPPRPLARPIPREVAPARSLRLPRAPPAPELAPLAVPVPLVAVVTLLHEAVLAHARRLRVRVPAPGA